MGDLVRHEALRKEIQRAHAFWNERRWGGKLAIPVFDFHPQPPNGEMLGHFRPASWEPGDRRTREPDEIIFYADRCLERGMDQVCETLVHEMVHQWQHNFGKRHTKYIQHNPEWKAEAERVGLRVVIDDNDRRIVWTRPGRIFREDFEAFGTTMRGVPHRPKNEKPGKLVKFQCGCEWSVRVGKPDWFQARCLHCNQTFRPAAARRKRRPPP